ncbi:hypothetical protein B0H15DRAFT_802371 [Mycena belliarum]|uniref:Uncharacterized protein n=1 Tax=Mycena belliarum TaxID=1033014 RepID=A0AAD6XPW3_9AGAR|nr:hypothetical protein B0H15DRAFT_802371 [Mycena belliae]
MYDLAGRSSGALLIRGSNECWSSDEAATAACCTQLKGTRVPMQGSDIDGCTFSNSGQWSDCINKQTMNVNTQCQSGSGGSPPPPGAPDGTGFGDGSGFGGGSVPSLGPGGSIPSGFPTSIPQSGGGSSGSGSGGSRPNSGPRRININGGGMLIFILIFGHLLSAVI